MGCVRKLYVYIETNPTASFPFLTSRCIVPVVLKQRGFKRGVTFLAAKFCHHLSQWQNFSGLKEWRWGSENGEFVSTFLRSPLPREWQESPGRGCSLWNFKIKLWLQPGSWSWEGRQAPRLRCRAADPLQSATVTCWGSSSSGPVPAPALRVRRCGSTCCGTAVRGLSVGKGKCCSASAETRTNRERAESRGRSCLHARGHRRARNATAVICGRVFGTRWLTRGGRDRCQTLSLSGASSPLCVVLYLLLNKGSATSNWAGPAVCEA